MVNSKQDQTAAAYIVVSEDSSSNHDIYQIGVNVAGIGLDTEFRGIQLECSQTVLKCVYLVRNETPSKVYFLLQLTQASADGGAMSIESGKKFKSEMYIHTMKAATFQNVGDD